MDQSLRQLKVRVNQQYERVKVHCERHKKGKGSKEERHNLLQGLLNLTAEVDNTMDGTQERTEELGKRLHKCSKMLKEVKSQ